MVPRRTLLLGGGAAFAASLFLPRCTQQAPAGLFVIGMKGMVFAPIPTGLRVGDAIDWLNDDIFVHTATAQDGSFDVELQPKARATTVLTRPGDIPFACRYHPGMRGVLSVAA